MSDYMREAVQPLLAKIGEAKGQDHEAIVEHLFHIKMFVGALQRGSFDSAQAAADILAKVTVLMLRKQLRAKGMTDEQILAKEIEAANDVDQLVEDADKLQDQQEAKNGTHH